MLMMCLLFVGSFSHSAPPTLNDGRWRYYENLRGQFGIPPLQETLLPDGQSAGARVLVKSCSQCHHAPTPGMHSAAEWREVVDRMSFRLQLAAKNKALAGDLKAMTADERRSLEDYLTRYALKSWPTEGDLDVLSKESLAFQKSCGVCHALPDPGQHTASEWKTVAERMKRNMALVNMPAIKPADWRALLSFLERNAAAK